MTLMRIHSLIERLRHALVQQACKYSMRSLVAQLRGRIPLYLTLVAGCATSGSTGSSAVPSAYGRVGPPSACVVTGAWSTEGTPIRAPTVESCALPLYAGALRSAGEEGRVIVRLQVDSAGLPIPKSIQIMTSTSNALSDAVRASVRYVRFSPRASTEPRPVIVEMPFVFTLGHP